MITEEWSLKDTILTNLPVPYDHCIGETISCLLT